MRNYFLLLLFFLIFSIHINGHDKHTYYFDHFDINNGLSQNTVNCIFQDSKGFMWFGTKNGLNRFDGYNFKIHSRNASPYSLGNSIINCITEDSNNQLWIGTDKGIYLYNQYTETFSPFNKQLPTGELLNYDIRKILFHNNQIWIKVGFTLFIYDINHGFVQQQILSNYHHLTNNLPSDFIADGKSIWMCVPQFGLIKYENGNFFSMYNNPQFNPTTLLQKGSKLYIGTNTHTVFVYDKSNEQIQQINIPVQNNENIQIRTLANINNDIWIGTENGIYILNENNEISNIQHNENDIHSLSNNAIYAIFQDRDNGIWIGSYFGGIDYLPKHQLEFEKFYPNSTLGAISGYRVREMCQDQEGNIWIATEDAGLNLFNNKTNTFTHFTPNTPNLKLSYYNIQCIHIVGNELWIGYFNKGIDVVNLKTKTIKHYDSTSEPSLNNNDIFSIFADNSGQVWIGTSSGVFLFDREHEKFIKNEDIGTFYISDIHQDFDGYIWFATYNIGVIKFNPHINSYKRYTYNSNDSTSICYHRITTIFEDSHHNLWFGSEDGGLCKYNKHDDNFKRITEKDGLPSNVIHKILEYNSNTLWISTNNGLVNYNPDNGHIKTYNTTNGLLCKQFNYNSGIKVHDKLYFGNIRGLVAFNPINLTKPIREKHVTLTKFQIFNQDIQIGGPDSILRESISYTNKVTLDYKKSSFNIEFSSLDFASKESDQYAYILTGVDNDWIYTNAHSASYNNIQPGKYTFKVKVKDENGSWNTPETCLSIIVSPPWWKTNTAYVIYILLFIGSIYYSVQSYRKKMYRKMIQHQQEQEQKKQEEIYTAKIDFFTNIAHEIRTPLTLIKVPLDEILKKQTHSAETFESLTIIKRNTDRLFSLINQLLDFRKIESKVIKLHIEDININTLINDTLARFKPIMEQNGLQVSIHQPEQAIIIPIDKEAITKVISNLFTNATKFAKSYVKISLTKMDNFIEIRVNNDGERIQPEFKSKIFEAFYQINRNEGTNHYGSGLGLSLAASLVTLHKGQIFVDENAEDTSFVVQIPFNNTIENNENAIQDSEILESNIENSLNTTQETNNSILVVEDNKELQQFLYKTLSQQYTVYTAGNGKEALDIINKEKINLIVSDIIMPIMDGIELCNAVTSDISTCHIPVILLTAKTNLDSKIKALKHGAAAYIDKPFSMEYLEAQISNLISNHKKLLKNFEQNPFINSSELARNKTDEQFLNKITDIIIQNIDNENFKVDELASEVNMSRTSLHRKLKESYNMTPGDFIRVIRLKKAAELIQNGEYRINEICILVGFHSQSYFTKSFQKQFGVLPKDFMKTQKANQSAKNSQTQ